MFSKKQLGQVLERSLESRYLPEMVLILNANLAKKL